MNKQNKTEVRRQRILARGLRLLRTHSPRLLPVRQKTANPRQGIKTPNQASAPASTVTWSEDSESSYHVSFPRRMRNGINRHVVRRQRILARGLRHTRELDGVNGRRHGQKTANPRQGIKTFDFALFNLDFLRSEDTESSPGD